MFRLTRVPHSAALNPIHTSHRPRSVLWLAGVSMVAAGVLAPARDLPASPDVLYGGLFADVQRARIFPDQKTFADCVARSAPETILSAYAEQKTKPGFDLKQFVAEHFLIPEPPRVIVPEEPTMEAHIQALWGVLQRAPDREIPGSSLLPLPHPYVVPGGRFREIYYWDSYFTMLGLRESGREDLIESMIDNFASELTRFGLIPNGNRTYYLSRSQPPFFALMVEFLAEKKGPSVLRKYRSALEQEYAYWTDRTWPTQHVVRLPNGVELSRYYDREDTPRPEAFALDEEVAAQAKAPRAEVMRSLRSTAESGWDFSSRWFADGRTLATIQTTDIVPVDLNALLWNLEDTLARAYQADGDKAKADELAAAAERRKRALLETCWSERDGFFVDCDLRTGQRRDALTLAGAAPLFLKIATPAQAKAVATTLRRRFLRPGGVVTTLVPTGQQWDAPNGWAPLEWMTIRGLANYGENELAAEIAHRWIALNRAVYQRTGKLMEKYNVEDTSLLAGGGEYPSQDGFGWTNGVLLALLRQYPDAASTAGRKTAP